MNIFDIVIVLLIILSGVNGYRRGILREGVMLFGTIFIYIISFLLKNNIGVMLCKTMPFFKFNGITAYNILVYQLIAFIIVAGILFSIFGLVLKLTGILQKMVNLSIILDIPSKILGFIAGLIEGYVVIFALLIILSIPLKDNELYTSSKLNRVILSSSPVLSNTLGNLDDLIIDIYDITNENSNNIENTKLLQLYTKYNIISKDDLEDIKRTGKLK